MGYRLCGPDESTGIHKLDDVSGDVIAWFAEGADDFWQGYQAWKALGNTPDPQYTTEEIAQNEYNERQEARIQTLKDALVSQFEIILAIYQVGRDNGAWAATDFSQEIRDKAAEWVALIDEYHTDAPGA